MYSIDPLDTHANVLELLPWYVNETLTVSERAIVQDHLNNCLNCRREFKRLSVFSLAVKSCRENHRAESFERLMSRIDEADKIRGRHGSFWISTVLNEFLRWVKTKKWVFAFKPSRHSLVMQSAAVVFLVVTGVIVYPWIDSFQNDYRTLSAPSNFSESQTPQLRIVFSAHVNHKHIEAMLKAMDGVVIASSRERGIYTIAMNEALYRDADKVNSLILLLQQNKDILFVEHINPYAQP